MAYFKITQSKKGELQAKIQVCGKDLSTGKSKVFTKRVYNTDELTEAKFRKQVEKTAIAFEEEVSRAYQDGKTQLRSKVLTFSELMQEWKANIKAGLFPSTTMNVPKRSKRYSASFWNRMGWPTSPSLPSRYATCRGSCRRSPFRGIKNSPKARLKKPLPKQVNFRLMARENVIDRCASYNLNKKGANIAKETRKRSATAVGLTMTNTLKRSSLKNPMPPKQSKAIAVSCARCSTKLSAMNGSTRTPYVQRRWARKKAIPLCAPCAEKEVFTVKEARAFLRKLDEDIPDDEMHKKVILKFILLTGVRNGEMCGLKWSDIDFDKKVVHIRRNRLYSKQFGYYEKTPKTKTSVRDIPLTDALIDDLKKYMDWFRLADSELTAVLTNLSRRKCISAAAVPAVHRAMADLL